MMFRAALRRRTVVVPALLTTIAYVDPGNFGTNIAAGTQHGYALVWVVAAASIAAAVVQYLAAKLGAATGQGLAENCADRLNRPARLTAWLQAELVVIMTDLAEIVGGALGLYLLFGIPLPIGAVIIGATSFVILAIPRNRFRPIALVMLLVVAGCVIVAAASLRPDLGAAAGGLRPQVMEASALLLAMGIVGATVMPHAIYFHSAMSEDVGRSFSVGTSVKVQPEDDVRLRRWLATSIGGAMAIAGLVNVAILVLGAAVGPPGGESIETASAVLVDTGRELTSVLLGVALLASGLASSIVGAWTGQAVMKGFLRVRIAAWKRRAVSLVPPVIVLAFGIDATWALVASQVVLSLALPFTLFALALLTSSRRVMGTLRNGRAVATAAWTITAIVTVMDVAAMVVLFRGG